MIHRLVTVFVLSSFMTCALTLQVSSSAVSLQKDMASSVSGAVLGSDDVLDVKFRFSPELDYQQTIRPDGKISLQVVDDVMAAGLTPEGLYKHRTQLYATKLKYSEITFVTVLSLQFDFVGLLSRVGTAYLLPEQEINRLDYETL